MLIWDRQDYLKEADRQLSDNKIYRDVELTKIMLSSLVDKVIKYFKVYLKRNTYQKKNLNTLFAITKMLLTWESYIFYLRFTSFCLMFLGDQSYQTVELIQK